MLKLKALLWLAPATVALNLLVAIAPVQANCAGSIGTLEPYQPVMERMWRELQEQTNPPWGEVNPFGTLEGDRITLTAEFERLNGSQKQQVIEALRTFPPYHELTPAEQEAMNQVTGTAPYRIYASDGRLLFTPYDACSSYTLLTEKARYAWYYNYLPIITPNFNPDSLRNAGNPSWRQVRFPIAAEQERNTRLQFWRTVGWNATDWWIAWVPENGYFEINVPTDYNQSQLERFWQVAPRQYRYVVVATDGTVLQERTF